MRTTHNSHHKNSLGRNVFRDEAEKYLKHWPWFLICLIISISAGYIYLKYATPVYRATTSLIINDEAGSNNSGETAAFNHLGLMSGLGTNSIEKELTILKSRRLMKDVVQELKLNVFFFQEGQVKEIELYENLPFSFKVLKLEEDQIQNYGDGIIRVSGWDGKKIKVTHNASGKSIITNAGNPINLGFANVVITPDPGVNSFSDIIVKFSKSEDVASMFRGRIQINQPDKNSYVLELHLEDPVIERAQDILDQLIFEFNRDAIEDKNLVAGNTAKFINERLDIINDELQSVESGKEEFKESHKLTDIQAESRMYMQSASEYNQRRQEIGTQMELAEAMLDYLSSSSNSDLLPANLGIEENAVNQQIGEYNELVLERNRILGSSTEKNPVVIRLNSRIEQIRSIVKQGLQRLSSNLQIALDDVNRQYSSIGARIMSVPSKERQYRGIERQQGIKEALYLFLLQKREENSLALAITAPKAKVVDRAYKSGGMVSPTPKSIYLGTVILGLFVPFSIIYVRNLFDNKIKSKADVEKIDDNLVVLGEIPKVVKKSEFPIKKNDRSVLAESYRILITNMEYLLVSTSNKKGAKTILVTSTVKSEGKTFTSLNLGVTFANLQKKVLIVGADLRNPKLNTYVDKRDNFGVSDYLSNENLCLKRLIGRSTLHPDLDIIPSGINPPNPNELLRSEKTCSMFEELEQYYDYIIVDTAPAMVVADTLSLTKYSDLILYVIRAGYTEKKLLEFLLDAKRTETFSNVGIIVNNVASTHLTYGSQYGYGYGIEKTRAWYQAI